MASGTGGGAHRRQRRMGPAPFASFEDLSDEVRPGVCIWKPNVTHGQDLGHTLTHTPYLGDVCFQADSPSEGPAKRLPGITEDTTTSSSTLTPSAPRIDISRASSSSQHDSRDSTPERELFQTPGRLGLAFREEGALELRSSTEELDFQDPNDPPLRRGSPATIVTASSTGDTVPIVHQRKDSQGSEFGGLLSISGRTSRLSSIGSQGSHVSGQSRLSVTSGISRSPSPHKMLLETSFCGSKLDAAQTTGGTSEPGTNKVVETELLERVLLSRKHDPTEAILAEGISIECRRKIQPADSLVQLSPVLQHAVQQAAETPPQSPSSSLTHASVPASLVSVSTPASNLSSIPKSSPSSVHSPVPIPPEKPARKSIPQKVSTDVIITVNKPTDEIEIIHNDSSRSSPLPGKLVAESGIEYTFIPLKGPLPKENDNKLKRTANKSVSPVPKINNSVSNTSNNPIKTSTTKGETQYIRIKLKPDYMYPDEPTSETHMKPASLDLSNGTAAPAICRSPLQNNTSTPSPSISRKSSFASLFRGKDYGTSPESPTVPATAARRKSRSRSKSSDRDRSTDNMCDKQSKHRSVFTLFKSKKTYSKSKQSLTTETSPGRHTATSLHSLEFTFDQPPPPPSKKYYEIPLDADTIIIPLHSPGTEPPPLPLFADDTEPIEPSTASNVTETVAPVTNYSHRQSSTSSENVVFTTNLGSDNEIFTTKLPKRKHERERSKENQEKNITSITNIVELDQSPSALQVQNGIIVEQTVVEIVEEERYMKTNEQIEETMTERQSMQWKLTQLEEKRIEEKIKETEKNSSSKVDKIKEELVEEKNINKRADVSERAGEDNHSSESDSEALHQVASKRSVEIDDESSTEHERKGLVLQQDSFEDDLPYVPTTLPLERSVAVPIVPVKQRAAFEIRTCPIERPRSTTPINPSCLDDYCEDNITTTSVTEKLRISLPREDSITGGGSSSSAAPSRGKSPRRWTEFVPRQQHPARAQQEPAPPLPPRGAPRDWINFEEIPERRKPPKRIQTIPSRGTLHATTSSGAEEQNVIYSYVNPEDCKCECHETGTRANSITPTTPGGTAVLERHEEDELPLLLSAERRSDSSPESQGAAPLPPAKRSAARAKPTNAFPHVATTSS